LNQIAIGASEWEAHDSLRPCVHRMRCANSSVSSMRRNELTAELSDNDSEFQNEGTLTKKAVADND